MCETDNFAQKFRPEGVKCAQIFYAQIELFNLLNILKQKKGLKICLYEADFWARKSSQKPTIPGHHELIYDK